MAKSRLEATPLPTEGPAPAGAVAAVRDALARQPDIVLAFVFGSFAAGTQRPDSDIDIAVAGARSLDASRRLALTEALAEVTARAVDLVDLHEAGPLLLTEALTNGKPLLRRDRNLLARLLVKMVCLNEDFMPLVRRIQDARRKRFLHA